MLEAADENAGHVPGGALRFERNAPGLSQQFLERHARLEARDRRTDAEVNAMTENEMTLSGRPIGAPMQK